MVLACAVNTRQNNGSHLKAVFVYIHVIMPFDGVQCALYVTELFSFIKTVTAVYVTEVVFLRKSE